MLIKKITLYGASSSGKTTLLQRCVTGKFTPSLECTIGADTYCFDLNDDHITLWDTAGQERFKSISQSYFRGSNGIILVLDLSTNSDGWNEEIRDHFSDIQKKVGLEAVSIFLIGNKADLIKRSEKEQKQIAFEALREPFNFKGIFQVSAKTGRGVQEAFQTIFTQVIEADPAHVAARATHSSVLWKERRLLHPSSKNDQPTNTRNRGPGCC